jgi:hypothetical protein
MLQKRRGACKWYCGPGRGHYYGRPAPACGTMSLGGSSGEPHHNAHCCRVARGMMSQEPVLVQCPHCYMEVDERATACPYCQRSIDRTADKTPSGSRGLTGRTLLILMALTVGCIALYGAIMGEGNGSSSSSRGAAPAAPQSYRVMYRVTGSGNRADVTYSNESENTEQAAVTLTWEKHFEAERGQFLYISAQSTDDGSRTIKCSIVVNGVVLEQAESSGRYVIATCSGSAR